MELRKFPVTAPSGNEYEAVIKPTYENVLSFELFERRTVRNWLGRERVKYVSVAHDSFWEIEVTDVIAIVTVLVSRVEKRKEDATKRAAAYEAFAHWDGHVSPKEAAK